MYLFDIIPNNSYYNYVDDLIDIPHSFWTASGGTDSALFEMNVNIPWKDIESWLHSNYGYGKKTGKIKSVYLIPEITLLNPPLNSATIEFKNMRINNQKVSSYSYAHTLNIPKEMQDSEWTSSDIGGVILKILGYSTAITSFVPGLGLASGLTGIELSIVSEINDSVSKSSKKNYIYTNKEENRIKIASNINLEEGKDFNINIPTIEVTGKRNYGYWADFTHATLSNLFVVLELE